MNRGYYRARMWHLRVDRGELQINQLKVRSKDDKVQLLDEVTASQGQVRQDEDIKRPKCAMQRIAQPIDVCGAVVSPYDT